MQLGNIREQGIFEERFWMEIFGDHARFINQALTINAQQELEQARAFIRLFDMLADWANVRPHEGELLKLHKEALEAAHQLKAFKLRLLNKKISGSFEFRLPPTYLYHMVAEAEEGIRVISALAEGEQLPKKHVFQHPLVWLEDQDTDIHTDSLDANPGLREKELKALIKESSGHLQWMYMKAVELAGYVRTRMQEFPTLHRFNIRMDIEMVLFLKLKKVWREMDIHFETLGTLRPLLIDHMAREECYYLLKLFQTTTLARYAGSC